jgi:hypothetical protein
MVQKKTCKCNNFRALSPLYIKNSAYKLYKNIDNNDTLDNLETNLREIENSKLIKSDFPSINTVDIDN